MAVVPRVFLDHVDEDPVQRNTLVADELGCLVRESAGVVQFRGGGQLTAVCHLGAPGGKRIVDASVRAEGETGARPVSWPRLTFA